MTRRILSEDEVKKLIQLKNLAREMNCYIFDDGKHFNVRRKHFAGSVFVAKRSSLSGLAKLLKGMLNA